MPNTTPAPWHLKVVGVLSLLWSALGGIDYIMTRLHSSAYLSQLGDPAAILAWIDRMPPWVHVAWPVGVWGAVLGSILLLARSRSAVWVFLISLVGAVANTAYQWTAPVTQFTHGGSMLLMLVICLVAALLWLYSRRMAARGVLG